MNLSDLKYFLSIAQGLRIEEVAAIFNITPSSVSKGLKRLEAELNVELMDRSHRTLSLTAGGHHFLRKLRPLLEQYEELMNSMEFFSDARIMRVCAIPSFYALDLLQPIQRFHELYPDVYLVMSDSRSYEPSEIGEYLNLLRNDSVDLVFSHKPIANVADLDGFEVYRDYIVSVTKNDHPFSQQESVTVEDLQRENVCLSGTMENFCSYVAPIPKEQNNILHGSDLVLNLITKKCDVCLYLASEVSWLMPTRFPGFTVRRVANVEEIPVMLFVRKDRTFMDDTKIFVDFILETVKNQFAKMVKDATQWDNITYQ